ncbi:uncharacterized protein LOC123692266 [Colias croceus]|uniref:uncharacterized protein LOC123692266 n=1 Tax=Colias crocea TaxID=72248 RepID=UPI001E28146A|nr:uncharacterized protein LOC123692266 [Colias croceus]
MYKSIVIVCALYLVVTEARPKWQYLPEVPGYVPVYIRNGDTPLEDINPELAEAFHAPAGRSAGKQIEAVPDIPELNDKPQPTPDAPNTIDKRPYEKVVEKKKKATFEIPKPIEH